MGWLRACVSLCVKNTVRKHHHNKDSREKCHKAVMGALTRTCGTVLRAGTLVLGGALLVSQAAHANFVNGGFESGLTGWTPSIYSNYGITTFPPTQKSHLNLQTANASYPNTLTTTTSGFDANTGASNATRLQVPRPGFGAASARVNGALESYRTSSLQQTITMAQSDVAGDGNIHVRFTMAPVLQNPGHNNNEQPYFFVELTNVTKGTRLFTQFNFANQPGVNWQSYNGVQFTDWVTVDVPLPPGQVNVGDQINLEIIAAGCSLGGHWGYVYVDEATTAPLPGLVVTASGPSGIVLNPGAPYSTITYTYTYTNNSTVPTDASTVNVVLPVTGNGVNTTFNSINSSVLCTTPAVDATGTVSCNFGTLQPSQTGTFTVTVNVPPTASTTPSTNVVNHGNYNISATNVPALTGPLVVTNVYATGVVLDITKTGVGTGTVSSSPTGIICGAGCTTANMTVAPNTPVTLTAAAAVGSTFTGWSGGGCSGTAPTCTVPMSASSSVTANFDPVTYPLTATTTGSGTITSSPGSINCPASCSDSFNYSTTVTLTATPQAGQAFTGWGGACSGTAPTCTVTMDQARNVTASFVPTFPLNVTATGPGSVTSNVGGVNCGATCSATFNSGTLVTLTANTSPNSVFTGWSGGGGCSGTATTCTVTMDQARNVTATFVPTYVVTPSVVGGTGGGTITPNTPSTVNSGTQVVYTLSPTPGYRAQVAGTCGGVLSGNTFTTSAVTADCTVVVTFAVIPANPVPTLSQWGLILMTALLALLAVGQLPLRNNRRP